MKARGPSRRLALLLTAAVFVACAACSATDDTVPTPQVLVATAAWNDNDSPAEREAFMKILDKFTDRTGIVVSYRAPEHAADFATVLPQWLKTTNAERPDVALLPQPSLLSSLYACSQLRPLSQETQGTIERYYSPAWQRFGKVSGDDNMYGLVFKVGNKSAVWYNTGMMQASGASVPVTWTWDEFLATTQAASAGLASPALAIGAQDTDSWVLTDWFENVYLRVAGKERYEQLARGAGADWQDQTVVAALTHLADLWRHSEVIGSPLATSRSQAFDHVFGGTISSAMLVGDFVPEVNHQLSVGLPQESVGLAQFPSIGGSGPAVISGADIAVVTSTDQVEPAQELVNFLASPDAAAVWADAGFITPNTGINDSAYTSPVIRKARAEMLDESTLVEFDLSDQLPKEFAGTPEKGLQEALASQIKDPAPESAQRTATALASEVETLKTPGCG